MKRFRGFDYTRHLKASPVSLFLASSLGLGATPPLSFEANRGQTDPAVNFLSRGDGYALFLTPNSAVFKLRSCRENSAPSVVRMILAGAHPHARVSGASPMLGPDGSLVLTLDGAPLTFRKPLAWQTIAGRKQMIAGNYKLSGDRVQFALGKYDHSRALVIDPVVTYFTYLGGNKDDIAGNTTYSPGDGNP